MAVWMRAAAGNESLLPQESYDCYISMSERREMYQLNQIGASVDTFPVRRLPDGVGTEQAEPAPEVRSPP